MASIYKRGTTYTVNVSIVINGVRKRKTKSGFKSKREANAWAANVENMKHNDELSSTFNSKITVAEYFEQWLDTYKPHIKSTSMLVYRATLHSIRNSEALANIRAFELTRTRAQQFINEFGSNHARATTQKRKSQLRSAYSDAVLDGFIKTNPFDRIAISGRNPKELSLKYLETDDYLELIEKLKMINTSNSDIILIGALTGARIGEILALTTDDITDGLIDINKTEQSATRKVDTVKTKSSVRKIDVPIWLTDRLLSKYDGRLFNISQVAVNKAFKKLQVALDLDHVITFHGLRHTHASYLLSQDVSIDYISRRLGHSSTAITLKVYAHLLTSKKQKEVNKTLALFD